VRGDRRRRRAAGARAQGGYDIHSQHTEAEGYDRRSLELPGMQETFARLLARLTATPLIVVLVHGGPVDVAWLQESPRVDAILTAWYPGEMVRARGAVARGEPPRAPGALRRRRWAVGSVWRLPARWPHDLRAPTLALRCCVREGPSAALGHTFRQHFIQHSAQSPAGAACHVAEERCGGARRAARRSRTCWWARCRRRRACR
jgi:hypothetical protein